MSHKDNADLKGEESPPREFPALTLSPSQIPSMFLQWLGIHVSEDFPLEKPPKLPEFLKLKAKRLMIVIIENFGMFELVVYEPAFFLQQIKGMIILDTERPYTFPIIQKISTGSLTPGTFNVFDFLKRQGKKVEAIGRDQIIKILGNGITHHTVEDDSRGYIQVVKASSEADVRLIVLSDFQDLIEKQSKKPPFVIAKGVIKLATSYLGYIFNKLRKDDVMVVIGTSGRYDVDYKLKGRLSRWRKENQPVMLVFQK